MLLPKWMGRKQWVTISQEAKLPGSRSEKAVAPHSSTLAWKIPWTEDPGRLQSMGSRRVGHDWATSLSLFTFTHWGRQWQPTPVFLPGESQGRGSLVGCRLWGRRVGNDWNDLAAAAAGPKDGSEPSVDGGKGPQQSSVHLQRLKNMAFREGKSVRYFLRNMNRTSCFQKKRMKGKLIGRARPMIWLSVDSLHQENTYSARFYVMLVCWFHQYKLITLDK